MKIFTSTFNSLIKILFNEANFWVDTNFFIWKKHSNNIFFDNSLNLKFSEIPINILHFTFISSNENNYRLRK